MKDIKAELMDKARELGICKDGFSTMSHADMDVLVEYYTSNPDWCLERNYPTLPYLQANFSDIEDKGVFVDKIFNGELLNEKQAYIFHNCKGRIKVAMNENLALIPMLYFANGCRMIIKGEPSSQWQRSPVTVPLYEFGKNDISAHDGKFVKYNRYKSKLL